MANKQTTSTKQDKLYTVKGAAAYLGLSTTRIGGLLRQGQLKGVKATLGDSDIKTWQIPQSELERYWATQTPRRGRKYLVRLTAEQYEQVSAYLAELGIAIEVANKTATKIEATKAEADAEAEESDAGDEEDEDEGEE